MNIFLIYGIGLGCVIFLIILWFISGYITFSMALKRKGIIGKLINKKFRKTLSEYKIDPSWWNKHKIEKLKITSDNQTLTGFFIQNNNSNKIAILIHGYYGNHVDISPQAKIFFDNGFSIFAPDLRTHGLSTGKNISMGYFEKNDIVKWIEELNEKFNKNCQIIIFGESMGAATTLLVSNENLPSFVKCVIADSSYSNAYEQMKYVLCKRALIPSFLLLPQSNFFCKRIANFDLKKVSPIDAVKKTKLPILFFHGLADKFVPSSMTEKMFKVCNKNICEMYLIKNAKHIRSYATDEFFYTKKIVDFVNKWVI